MTPYIYYTAIYYSSLASFPLLSSSDKGVKNGSLTPLSILTIYKKHYLYLFASINFLAIDYETFRIESHHIL